MLRSELLTKEEVCIQTALVGFVNDDAAVLGEQEVLLQLPQQDTIRHELQRCLLAQPAIIPHLHMQNLVVVHADKACGQVTYYSMCVGIAMACSSKMPTHCAESVGILQLHATAMLFWRVVRYCGSQAVRMVKRLVIELQLVMERWKDSTTEATHMSGQAIHTWHAQAAEPLNRYQTTAGRHTIRALLC